MKTEKATLTNLTLGLSEELHKAGFYIYPTDNGTFELEKEIEEEHVENEKQKQEAENFEEEFKKMLADIAHDETIPF